MKRKIVDRIDCAFLKYTDHREASARDARKRKELEQEAIDQFTHLSDHFIKPALMEVSRYLGSKGHSALVEHRLAGTKHAEISMRVSFCSDPVFEIAALSAPSLSFRPGASLDSVVVGLRPCLLGEVIERQAPSSAIDIEFVHEAVADLMEKALLP